MLSILSKVFAYILPILGTIFDKTLSTATSLAPIVTRNAVKYARVSLWLFGVLFVLNLSSSLLAFTFYHIGMAVVIALSNYTTLFTVTMCLNALLGICIFGLVKAIMPLIE
ncbi:MAG: hypothetical protein PHU93_01120 [Candidatus Gracilibacteria bacterium]|nr:hypothetical protein [Candidatus Gracilibacteria bacterium]